VPLIVVQARMNSERLPGKVLEMLGDRPVLQWVIERCQETGFDVCVATGYPLRNEALQKVCDVTGVSLHRGPEANVLLRFKMLHLTLERDRYVRITADCPFIDPEVLTTVAEADGPITSNVYPIRSYPRGLDVESFSAAALMASVPFNADDREHVTPAIYRANAGYNVVQHPDQSQHRWCLDTPDDLVWMREVVARLGVVTTERLLDFLGDNPGWTHYDERSDSDGSRAGGGLRTPCP